MKLKRLAACLMAACMLLTMAACKKEEEQPQEPEIPVDPNWPITLHFDNESVTLQEAANSIVSLSPAITELLYDMGESALLKGVSSYAPKQAATKEDCGTAQNIDLEAVKKLAPDLLFTDTPLLNEQLTQLQQMNVTVLEIARPESAEELQERAELILLALYGKEAGQEKADAFEEQLEAAWRPLKDSGAAVVDEEKKSVLLLADMDIVATGDCWEGELLEELGLNNLVKAGENWQMPQLQSAEDGTVTYLYGDVAVEWNPDVIIYNSDMNVEDIKGSELYLNSTAVENAALYPLDWSALQMQNLELTDALGEITAELYPDVWKLVQDAIAEEQAAKEAAAEQAAQAEAAAATTEQ